MVRSTARCFELEEKRASRVKQLEAFFESFVPDMVGYGETYLIASRQCTNVDVDFHVVYEGGLFEEHNGLSHFGECTDKYARRVSVVEQSGSEIVFECFVASGVSPPTDVSAAVRTLAREPIICTGYIADHRCIFPQLFYRSCKGQHLYKK